MRRVAFFALVLLAAASGAKKKQSNKQNKPTLWTELGINPQTHKPFLIDVGPLEAGGGACDTGTRQSPIDISGCSTASMNALRLYGHSNVRSEKFTMVHTGHTAQISFGGDAPVAFGGPLPENYTLLQMHFHWGEDDTTGSEHAVNGNYGAMEAHFVHFKSSYSDVDTAITHEDGLAVVGVIFTLQDDDNPALEGMLSQLSAIPNVDDEIELAEDSLTWMNDIMSYFSYYNYPGSLTTSPCSEVVNWIVMKKKLGVSSAQVARFRELMAEDGTHKLTSYRREPQSLKGREIGCAIGCALK